MNYCHCEICTEKEIPTMKYHALLFEEIKGFFYFECQSSGLDEAQKIVENHYPNAEIIDIKLVID
jgi:hypothetical protein